MTQRPAPRRCPRCSRAFVQQGDRAPAHLDAKGAPCAGTSKPLVDGAPRQVPKAPTPVERRKRTPRSDDPDDRRVQKIERRADRIRETAFRDLEERPATEDLEDSQFRAANRRGGLPSLGRGHR